MRFIIGQLQQLGMVVIIMLCALGGTTGILKLIKNFLAEKDSIKKWKKNRK